MPLKKIPPEDFRPLFENSLDAVFLTIPDGTIVAANPAACLIFRMTEAELCVAGRSGLVDSEDPAVRKFLREREELGKARGEMLYKRKDGSTFIGETSSVILQDGQRAFVIIRDISNRKTLEDERDLLMNELEAIIQFLPEGLLLCGPKGEILRLNPAAEALLGYSPELQRKSLEKRYPSASYVNAAGEKIPPDRLPLARALRGETVKMETVGYTRPSGEFLWLSVSAAPIFLPNGQIWGAVAIDSDITRLRQLQEEKDGYLHTITHDLNNPITIIQGHTELLRAELIENHLEDLARNHIESILIACSQMTSMIADLSEMARLEGGTLQLQSEPIDISRFLVDYLQHSRVMLDVSRVIIDMPKTLPLVWADRRSLERCLGNLIGNALKYSDKNFLVRLTAKRQGKEIVVSVIDQGPGIPPEDQPHIFDRFYRVANVPQQGLGLGLFITRSLVEANGGRIWLESKPGQGSTFHFSLPLATKRSMHSI
jgi:two-component system phosphate regulon sensor histidine kinase PhoR